MNIRYFSGSIVSLPLLPLLYLQGKKIRSEVPVLSEAKGNEGVAGVKDKFEKEITMLSVGESTIAGIGVKTHEEGFTGTLAAELSARYHLKVRWKVYAKSGYTVKRLTDKIVPGIKERNVDLIVIGIGGNDAFTLNTPWKWKSDVAQLIASLRKQHPEALIVFTNMPPIKEFPAFTPLIKFVVGNLVEILGDELQRLVQQYEDVYYCKDTITLEKWQDKIEGEFKISDYFSDGVHPAKLTYQLWAKDLARTLNNNGIADRFIS